MIQLNHLDKYFFKNKRNQIHVIDDVNLTFPTSGLVVLLGPSGSGKTTLLNVIGGLDRVERGEIVFDDQVIRGYKANQWDDIRNEKVGYIFQNYNLLPHLSVYENIAFVLRLLGITDEAKIEDSVHYILKAVGMYKYRKKRATQLSGGQQQRVAIARALVKNPEIVIADEPTGNLDSKNTLDVMKIIKEISKTKLVVLVTHEKDIAKIYGDRIIEIKDGKVISDHENTTKLDYEHIDDNIVYLKDMHEHFAHEDKQFEIKMFDESNEPVDPVKVRLIVRNKTLYIDVDSSFQKVKLIDDNSNLILKDEHYNKEDQQELTETTFDSNYLDLKGYKKQNKALVSIKQIFMLAIQKVLQSTRKGKLLLFSFIISGAMIALAMSLAANFFIPNKALMVYDNDYVIATYNTELTAYQRPTYQDFKDAMGENDFMNLLPSASFDIVDQQTNATFLNFFGAIDLIDNLSRPKVVEGVLAENRNQIMISTALADSLFETSLFDFSPELAQEYGIWNYSDLLKEKIVDNNQIEYEISGIIKSNQKIIYLSKDTYYSMLTINLSEQITTSMALGIYYGYNQIDSDQLIYGSVPTDDSVILSDTLLTTLGYASLLDDATTWPQEVTYFGSVSGVVESNLNIALVDADRLTEKVFNSRVNSYNLMVYIHTDNPRTLINNINQIDTLVGYKESTFVIAQSMLDVTLTFMIPMIVIIFSTSFLGFYFLMHSTLISRIYETSVYRSLGMKKKDLFISYIVESSFITTITSILGYTLATIALVKMSSSSLGFSPFIATPVTILIGLIIVYVINISAGMLPISRLLRKTPSEIASKYDI